MSPDRLDVLWIPLPGGYSVKPRLKPGTVQPRDRDLEQLTPSRKNPNETHYIPLKRENAMANAFWVSVRNNISKRWNTTENDVSKNQSSADSAIRLPNTSILNSNAADITEYFLDVYTKLHYAKHIVVLYFSILNSYKS
ncbi:hypothetical protein TNCV_3402611 [Trichonephila clavipes]|nr:hypothetical protein TNCV_3402611 [Trichonephila clavipes]